MEFKTLVIRTLSELRGRIVESSENFIKMEIENKKASVGTENIN